MQIKCNLKPMCETCSELELDVRTDVMFADGSLFGRSITVQCKKRCMCDNIEYHVKQHIQNDVKTEQATQNLFDKSSYKPFDV